jgi:hypothetical protein
MEACGGETTGQPHQQGHPGHRPACIQQRLPAVSIVYILLYIYIYIYIFIYVHLYVWTFWASTCIHSTTSVCSELQT